VSLVMTNVRVPRPRTGHAVLDLLNQSRACLAEAASATTACERYAAAHLAALRAGAAVLAARARAESGGGGARQGRGRPRGPRNVWTVLATIAPELAEWADFFAAGAAKRAAAEAGLPGAATAREADDLLRDADAFLGLVSAVLGLPYQRPLSEVVVSLAG
jgi:SAV_6107-like HEPN